MPHDPLRREREIDQNFSLLSIGYYIAAALTALFGLIPIVHVVIGASMISGALGDSSGDPAERVFGFVFAGIGLMTILIFLAVAAVFFLTARKIRNAEGFALCVVAAALACCIFPIGTALGVLTFIFIFRDDVRPRFTNAASDP